MEKLIQDSTDTKLKDRNERNVSQCEFMKSRFSQTNLILFFEEIK